VVYGFGRRTGLGARNPFALAGDFVKSSNTVMLPDGLRGSVGIHVYSPWVDVPLGFHVVLRRATVKEHITE